MINVVQNFVYYLLSNWHTCCNIRVIPNAVNLCKRECRKDDTVTLFIHLSIQLKHKDPLSLICYDRSVGI